MFKMLLVVILVDDGGVRGGEVERERAPFQSDMSAPALVFPDSVNTSVGSQGR